MRVLLTGATGFVGEAVLATANKQDISVLPVYRILESARRCCAESNNRVVVPTLVADTDWQVALSDIKVVIHCAARVHVMSEHAVDPLAEFRKVNVNGTLNLAQQAAAAGVQRFIFLSSVKVNGEFTTRSAAFTSDDIPNPQDAYGVSKMEAEQGLRLIAQETGMEVVIIRPPLVYGKGVKANFASMMRWLKKGVPLPFGAIHNKRSLVALDNLVDLIVTCIDHPAAANQTFMVCDGEDLSTTDLLRRMGQALDKPARLLPVPAQLLRWGATLVGKPELGQRLCGSLQIDMRKTQELLGWRPPISVDEGLRRAALG